MCHHGQHIWILYNSGFIAVFDMDSHSIIQNIELSELHNDPVTILVVDNTTGLIAAAYTNGLIAYLWDGTIHSDELPPIVYFHSSSAVSYHNLRLTTVESCIDVDGHHQLWCSYDSGAIQIVTSPVGYDKQPKTSKVLQINEYCADLQPNTYIIQFRFSGNRSPIVYALHNGGLVISCWSVSKDPKLYSVIKNSSIAPGKIIANAIQK